MYEAHPLTRFELFCRLGRARRAYRLAARMFDPVEPERAPELLEEIEQLENLMKRTEDDGH